MTLPVCSAVLFDEIMLQIKRLLIMRVAFRVSCELCMKNDHRPAMAQSTRRTVDGWGVASEGGGGGSTAGAGRVLFNLDTAPGALKIPAARGQARCQGSGDGSGRNRRGMGRRGDGVQTLREIVSVNCTT